MSEKIYVQLFNEGAACYRPVAATQVDDNVFVLDDAQTVDSSDEQWQFLPGTKVIVEEKRLTFGKRNEVILAAVKALTGTAYIGDYGIAESKIQSVQQQGHLVALNLTSSGYGRTKGATFAVHFHEASDISHTIRNGEEVFGISETIEPGAPRKFHVMTGPDSSCMDLTAASYSIVELAGDEDIHDSWLVSIERVGADVVVTLKSDGWKRKRGARFRLIFKDAKIVLENAPVNRLVYGISQSTDEAGTKMFYFAAEDDQPCLQIEAVQLVISS